jgi:site-specific DNA recombinase
VARREVVAGDPRRAVAYLRVSTEDQNLGPEAQRAQIEAWAAREGVEVLAWHEDHGISGAKDVTARPALAAALAALRREGAGVLVVAKRDRIARDVLIAGTVDHLAGRAGARVVSADGIGNGDSPADQFMRTILDGASAFERAQIRARTTAALAVKKARGERVGGVPWGWRVAEDGVQLVPHEGERATAARAQALRAEGRSLAQVAAQLAAEGHTTRSGRAFWANLTSYFHCRRTYNVKLLACGRFSWQRTGPHAQTPTSSHTTTQLLQEGESCRNSAIMIVWQSVVR